ncbi:PspC domain-containing protein [Cellulomonas sp. DKR-3]|uniref:PspC domain-containing protein n=1 Tax=Cellulomonas fulva TaxID=2835530 RepID=A0ABS5TZ38_9CELL|nr:ATP-binding protein [Cellulomonas fulva]MBT0994404.1 PspC domain-containing protein [Cellulomonas fulva]
MDVPAQSAAASAARPSWPVRSRPPLRRVQRGRWVAGVAAGLAAHLDVPVGLVRLTFVVLGALGGTGVFLYGFWWLAVPAGDPWDAAAKARPSTLTRLARRPDAGPDETGRGRRWPVTDIAVGLLLVVVAAVLVALRQDRMDAGWVLPVLVLLAGVALAWSQLDDVARGRWRSRAGGRTPVSVLRLLGGVVLAGVGVLLLVGQASGPGVDAATLVQAVVASLAVLAGVALVLAPWWLRLWRELSDERAARARESERADIAAHLHDSVLQTLALIRARADDPEVARMARAQERELREWLYDDRPAPGTSLAAALRAVVAEVEDSRSGPGGDPVAVEAVVVGDRVPDDATAALLQATREALVNAVVHGRPPVSLYLEVGERDVEVFVKDRGDGFDPDDIGPDRFGVRESIMGRVRRRGGTAVVTSRIGHGTEVHLTMPFAPSPVTDEQPEREERGA